MPISLHMTNYGEFTRTDCRECGMDESEAIGDFDSADLRAVFTRAVASCTVALGRGPIAGRIALVTR
jgi:hypothetical protein